MSVNQPMNEKWLQIFDWPQRIVSQLRQDALPPTFSNRDEYRVTHALCTLEMGEVACNSQKSRFANSILGIFKECLPVTQYHVANNNSDAVEFAWDGNDYRILCGAGFCTLQRQVALVKSEWEQFLTGGILFGCSSNPDAMQHKDVDSFSDASDVSEITFCPIENKYKELTTKTCSSVGPISGNYSGPACTRIVGVYFDGKEQVSASHSEAALLQMLSTNPPPSKWTIKLSGNKSSYKYLDQFIDLELNAAIVPVSNGGIPHLVWDSSDSEHFVRISIYPELSPPRIVLLLGVSLYNGLGIQVQKCQDVYEAPCANQQCP